MKCPKELSGNGILAYFQILRPQLWDAPEWERTAFILSHAIRSKSDWDETTDALAEIIPEKREFWLRVQATWNTQFIEAMTAGFLEPGLSDEAAKRIGTAIGLKEQQQQQGSPPDAPQD